MGLRARKNALLGALKARALAYHLTPEQVDTFTRLYQAARTPEGQDEVSRALDLQINGWKTGTDAYSRILRAQANLDDLADEDEDDFTESHKEALARSRVSCGKPV